MAGNPFDTLGMYDNDLGGFFSSVKKAIKKVTKPIEKVVKKVTKPIEKVHEKIVSQVVKIAPKSVRAPLTQALTSKNPVKAVMGVHNTGKTLTHEVEKKVLPAKVREAKAKLQNDPRVKGVAKAVASVFVTPVVADYFVDNSITTPAPSESKKSKAFKTVKKGLDKVPKKAREKIDKDLTSIKDSPEFQEILNTMRDAGASKSQVVTTWTGSENYQNVATINAANAVYQQLYDEYIAAGASPEIADKLAKEQAMLIGNQAATEVAEKTSGGNGALLLAVGIPVAFALFGG